jgi:hypothetical protein
VTALLEFTSGSEGPRERQEVEELSAWDTELKRTSDALARRLEFLAPFRARTDEWDSAVVIGLLETIEETNAYNRSLKRGAIQRCLQNPPAVGKRRRNPSVIFPTGLTNSPPLHWPDYRDLVEIFQSHTLRLGLVIASVIPESVVIEEALHALPNPSAGKLIPAAGAGNEPATSARSGTLRAILKLWRSNPYQVPLAEELGRRKKLEEGSDRPGRHWAATLAGYSTSGSWLYSVHKRSLSLSLAKPLLEELTSLQAAEQRATKGAGLPARKDFYATSGDEYAPHCENLSWRDILRFAGSRCRERAQAVSPQDYILARFHLISERLLDLLQRAYDDRPPTADGMQNKLEEAVVRAVDFVQEIRQSVIDACPSATDSQETPL